MQPENIVTDQFFIVKAATKKVSSKGDTYLDLVFGNAEGEISSKLWDYKEGAHDWIVPNIIVKVRGNEEMWNDKKQFRLQRIRRVGPEDQLKMSDLVPCAPFEGSELFDQIVAVTDTFTDGDLKLLVQDILFRCREKMMRAPAAVRLHHAMCGGLLYHTLSVTRLAEGICQVYPNIRRDLLLSGAILHDIAKVDELQTEETGLASGYTTPGVLLGHLVMGAMEVRETAGRLGTDPETALLLEHMLLSHHGLPEYGCAVRPMFLEAEILSMVDNMDATIHQITGAVNAVAPGEFSEKLWALDQRKFYNHSGRQEEPPRILKKEI